MATAMAVAATAPSTRLATATQSRFNSRIDMSKPTLERVGRKVDAGFSRKRALYTLRSIGFSALERFRSNAGWPVLQIGAEARTANLLSRKWPPVEIGMAARATNRCAGLYVCAICKRSEPRE